MEQERQILRESIGGNRRRDGVQGATFSSTPPSSPIAKICTSEYLFRCTVRSEVDDSHPACGGSEGAGQ